MGKEKQLSPYFESLPPNHVFKNLAPKHSNTDQSIKTGGKGDTP